MNPIIFIPAFVIFVTLLGGSYIKGKSDGKMAVQSAWDKERADTISKQRDKERLLQEAADKIREGKDNEIKQINSRHAAIVYSLRNRPERTQMSSNPEACNGSTGAQLARGDAEFLAGYATDATKLQIAYDLCLSQYNFVLQELSDSK